MLDDKASVTALKVAMIILMLGGDEYGRSKCPPGSVEAQLLLLQACRLPFTGFPFVLIMNRIFAKFSRWMSSLTHQDLMEGVGIRKCFMESHVRNFLNDNSKVSTQVLIVGAGYDTLAYRLSQEYPSSTFWEVDHPATSRVKQQGLENLSPQPSNLHCIMADLSKTSLPQVLSQQSLCNPKTKTIVVMEGLLYYLDESQVKQLFRDVAQVTPKGSQVCFDFFGLRKDGQLDLGWMTPLLVWSIKFTGEPWKWGIAPDNLSAFFDDTTWRVVGEPQSIGIERLACVELAK